VKLFLGLESEGVPKVHAMTCVSLAIKNLWGCMPDPMRLRHHWNMNEILCALIERLPKTAAICDGTYFLNDFGPMNGTAIRRDIVVGSDNLVAASLLCSVALLVTFAPLATLLYRRRTTG